MALRCGGGFGYGHEDEAGNRADVRVSERRCCYFHPTQLMHTHPYAMIQGTHSWSPYFRLTYSTEQKSKECTR
jgi:hypothetical protein